MDCYNFENYIYLNEEKILLINTWLASMSYNWNKKQHILYDFKDYLKECDLISYTKCYDVLLSNILKEHNVSSCDKLSNLQKLITCKISFI